MAVPDDNDFFEEDEPVDEILARLEDGHAHGRSVVTRDPTLRVIAPEFIAAEDDGVWVGADADVIVTHSSMVRLGVRVG